MSSHTVCGHRCQCLCYDCSRHTLRSIAHNCLHIPFVAIDVSVCAMTAVDTHFEALLTTVFTYRLWPSMSVSVLSLQSTHTSKHCSQLSSHTVCGHRCQCLCYDCSRHTLHVEYRKTLISEELKHIHITSNCLQ